MGDSTGSAGSQARAMALETVRRSLEEHPELLIALQFIGALVPDALSELRAQDTQLIDRIALIAPAPSPAYERLPTRPPAVVVMDDVGIGHPERWTERAIEQDAYMRSVAGRITRNTVPRHPETGRTLFAMWVDGEVEFHPRIMGWSDDDSRAEGYEDGRYDG